MYGDLSRLRPVLSGLCLSRNIYNYAFLLVAVTCAGCMLLVCVRVRAVMGIRSFLLLAVKVWSFLCYCIRRQVRSVGLNSRFC